MKRDFRKLVIEEGQQMKRKLCEIIDKEMEAIRKDKDIGNVMRKIEEQTGMLKILGQISNRK